MRKSILAFVALLGLGFGGAAVAQANIPLANGAPRAFAIPGGNFTNAFYFDVGATDTRLRVALTTTAAADLDVLLRYGSPFPDRTLENLAPDSNYLYEYAHYRSISLSGNESIDIGTYNTQPVRAGRWYISIINFAGQQVEASVVATASSAPTPDLPIELVFDDTSNACDVAGWNDSSPRTPIGGNTGTTLGQQRRNALTEAARRLGLELKSPVPVRVQACFNDLGSGNDVTLASAGPRFIFKRNVVLGNFEDGSEAIDVAERTPWLPRNYTWFASAPTTKLAGARLCGVAGGNCNVYDIRTQFNIKVDGPDALGARGFYYGFNPATGTMPGSGDSDFVSVAMHEITHGLGFIALIEKDASEGEIGSRFDGFDDIYAANTARLVGNCLEEGCTALPFLSGTNADRAAAMTSFSNLRWADAEATESQFNPNRTLPAPRNLVTLWAPNPIQTGSTFSHISNALEAGSLMLAQAVGKPRQLGLALPMLNAVGWSSNARTAPAPVDPFSAQYSDPKRNGHGIDFSKVADNLYALIFYTFGANGEPEYYIAIGPMVDGVFMPPTNANGDSLVRYKYVNGRTPPQVADATVSGSVRLDFNEAAISPACNDGFARSMVGRTAVMTWSIGNDINQSWCMTPLLQAPITRPPVDFTGAWSAPGADTGWGFSLASFQVAQATGLFGLLYYPDADGNGRWAYLQNASFASGQQMNLVERRGYCRTCPASAAVLAGQFDDRNAGTVTLTLAQPSASPTAGNRAVYSVNYQTAPGGPFARDTSIIEITALPTP